MNIVLTVKKAIKLIDLKLGVKKIEPILQSKVVNPSINEQNITPDTNYNGLSNVVVNGVNSSIDSNIQSGNIKDGVSILGVEGNYEGERISDYFRESEIDITDYAWRLIVKRIPYFEATTSKGNSRFQDCFAEYIDVSGLNFSNTTTINSCFRNCPYLKEIDISMWNTDNLRNISNLFDMCTSLQKCDVRSIDFTKNTINMKTNIFGTYGSTNIPTNCLVIVKDQANKEWVQTEYSWLTNVKTVAEYENE